MAHFLSKLFNIRREEWPQVALLFLIVAIGSAGGIWGTTIAYASFLKQVGGLSVLLWVLVLNAILSTVGIGIYTAFVDRLNNHTLLFALYAFSFFSIGLGLVLLWWGLPALAYPVLYLLYFARAAVSDPHFITYVNSLYDIQSAKRILPITSAGFRAGAVVAGLTMPFLTTWLTSEGIVVLWWLTYLPILGLIWYMPYFLKKGAAQKDFAGALAPTMGNRPKKPSAPYFANVKEGIQYTLQSTYLRWMAAGTLILTMLLPLLEYRTSEVLLLEIHGTSKDLANFLAVLTGLGNMVILPMLMFGMSRLITRLGLGNATLIFPVGNLLIGGGLILAPGMFTAAGAHFDRIAFRSGFQAPIDGLLYNAVPLRVKGRAMAVVNGLLVPIGKLLGTSVLFLPFVALLGWFVPALIGCLALAYVAIMLVIRRQYSQALIKMLEQEDYSFLLTQEASDLTVADPAMLMQLQKKLKESTSAEFTIFMAQLISQIGGKEAGTILEQAARAAEDPRVRAALLDVLVAAEFRDRAVRQLYADLLHDPAGPVRQSSIAGLVYVSEPNDPQFLAAMLAMVADPELPVRVQVLSVLARSGHFEQHAPAQQGLEQLLNAPEPAQRAAGVRVLGQISAAHTLQRLFAFLADPADEVRLEAAVALEKFAARPALAAQIVPQIGKNIDALLQDPVERVRQAVLTILRHDSAQALKQPLLRALKDSSPQIRATAVETLARMGKSVIPVIHPELNASDPQLRKMAAVVLSRINPREFGAVIIGTNITGNLLVIYRNYGLVEALAACRSYPGIAILQSALYEQNQRLREEIFYLLEAIHNPTAIRVIKESLHNPSARMRTNAVEALESFTSPQTASLIAPLFELESAATQIFALSKATWEMEPPDTAQAIREVAGNSDEPWLRTITTFALGEIGASFAPKNILPQKSATAESVRLAPPPDTPSSEHKNAANSTTVENVRLAPPPDAQPRRGDRKARRAAALDLFGAMAAEGSKQEAVNSSPSAGASPQEAVASSPPADRPLPEGLEKLPFTLPEIEAMLDLALNDPVAEVRLAAQTAKGLMAGFRITDRIRKEEIVLSVIEKIIFLKEVPFFKGMTIEQLKILANVCEEEVFERETRIFNTGDPGGILYVVVNGRVGIEQEKRKGSFARLGNIEAHSYFGEMNLFDNSPRSTSALAIQDTLTLRLRREPLIALARQHPDLSLELINVLSQRLRETNDRIAELTKTRPRELHKLFDQFE